MECVVRTHCHFVSGARPVTATAREFSFSFPLLPIVTVETNHPNGACPRVEKAEAALRYLMIAALDGDSEAYTVLLSSVAGLLRRYFRRRLGGNLDEAEDLVQETLLAIHSKRSSYNRALPFTAWLYAIARYKLVDHFRRRQSRQTIALDDLEDAFGEDAMGPSLAAFDVEAMLNELSDKHRSSIVLTRIEGYAIAEAAEMTGQSQSAVKVGVHRGMKKMISRVKGSGRQ
jgi:RNA polymerase sigma-70 factor, ECF subfamily